MRKLLQHENVIKLMDVKEDAGHYYMVMELAPNGELFDYIGGGLREDVALFYFRQLVASMEYMHSQNVCHRDLKLENILLDPNFNMKVCDFGFSRLLSTTEGPSVMYTMCGSPAYVAPEILAGQGYDGRVADIWSCGVILCAMLTACLPVEDRAWDGDPFFDRLKRHQYDYEPWGQQLTGLAEDLCKHMLEADPRQRWTWEQIKRHPWFMGASIRPISHAALSGFMRAQKAALSEPARDAIMPTTPAASEVVVFRSHGADLGETGRYDEAGESRDGVDIDAIMKRQAVQDSLDLLPFVDEPEGTLLPIPASAPVPELLEKLQLALRDAAFVPRVLEDGATLKAKKMTPRGKLTILIALGRIGGGIIGQCTRVKGDVFLYKKSCDALAKTLA